MPDHCRTPAGVIHVRHARVGLGVPVQVRGLPAPGAVWGGPHAELQPVDHSCLLDEWTRFGPTVWRVDIRDVVLEVLLVVGVDEPLAIGVKESLPLSRINGNNVYVRQGVGAPLPEAGARDAVVVWIVFMADRPILSDSYSQSINGAWVTAVPGAPEVDVLDRGGLRTHPVIC